MLRETSKLQSDKESVRAKTIKLKTRKVEYANYYLEGRLTTS